ncbi:MAG TPA: hypothetical protein VN496_03365 [Burkholderiales bacterium]|nr:hypothetical protein [Burkholderiales bacterium]
MVQAPEEQLELRAQQPEQVPARVPPALQVGAAPALEQLAQRAPLVLESPAVPAREAQREPRAPQPGRAREHQAQARLASQREQVQRVRAQQ